MKHWSMRHITYFFIAISIVGGLVAAHQWFTGHGNFHLVFVGLNAFALYIWVRNSFEYRQWVTKRKEKQHG